MLTLNRVLPALLLAFTSLLPTTALAQRALPQSSTNRPLPGASLRTLLGQRTVSPAATPVQLRISPHLIITHGWLFDQPEGEAGQREDERESELYAAGHLMGLLWPVITYHQTVFESRARSGPDRPRPR